mgnify:CR=1 FL=1
MNDKQRSVIVITDTIFKDIRLMLHGVMEYVQQRGRWQVYLVEMEPSLWTNSAHDVSRWQADGLIVAARPSVRDARRIRALGLPTVVLPQPNEMHGTDYPLSGCPICEWDSAAIGRMAATYFLERRYRHFAYVHAPWRDCYWSDDREASFRKTIRKAGIRATCDVYRTPTARLSDDWMSERPALADWLRRLPKPCAVFAPNDRRGNQVLDACRAEGLRVPGEIAVLGVDDDEIFCESSIPTLSSIRCAPERAGFAIAETLDRMMQGRTIRRKSVAYVEPQGIVTRQSTDWTAVADDKVANILRSINSDFADKSLRVSRLALQSGLARRTLEIRFFAATGHSIRQEIESVRLSHAKTLLLNGDDSIATIATQCGFASATHFERAFKSAFSQTPTAFRATHS